MVEEFVSKLLELGYIGAFIGSMIEGETIIMSFAGLAYCGQFDIFYLMLVTFLGTLIADQLCFYIGRFFGYKYFSKFSFFNSKIKKVLGYIEKYDTIFILIFRFIYGIRILSPFVIGASKISLIKFTILNLIAAALWSISICSLGWIIGAIGSTLGNSFLFNLGFNFSISLLTVLIAHKFMKVK